MSQAKPPGPLPGWLLPSHQVKSHCAGSKPEEGVEYKKGKKNTSGGAVIRAGMKRVTFPARPYRDALVKSQQMPTDKRSGAYFLGNLAQMKSSLQM